MSSSISEEAVKQVLSKVIEPDLKKDLVALGLVKGIKVDDDLVQVAVEVSNPAMHSRKRMEDAILFQLEQGFGKDVKAEVTVSPLSSDAEKLRKILPGVKHIVAVASGKGGVGKSTITANLAIALAKQGLRVGLVDADIYGPSMPLMFDVEKERPKPVDVDGKNLIQPVEAHGVKLLSIGFFADPSQAIAWRGPMASKALNQMFRDAHWGDLDIMLIDMPPGTGDVHLSLVSAVPLGGALIVTTPQPIALADARKGAALFRMPAINVPVLGIVENMSWFTPVELPDNKYYIFGRDGAKGLSEEIGVPFLGGIPLVQSIREAGDVGRPAVLQESTPQAFVFKELAGELWGVLEKQQQPA